MYVQITYIQVYYVHTVRVQHTDVLYLYLYTSMYVYIYSMYVCTYLYLVKGRLAIILIIISSGTYCALGFTVPNKNLSFDFPLIILQ